MRISAVSSNSRRSSAREGAIFLIFAGGAATLSKVRKQTGGRHLRSAGRHRPNPSNVTSVVLASDSEVRILFTPLGDLSQQVRAGSVPSATALSFGKPSASSTDDECSPPNRKPKCRSLTNVLLPSPCRVNSTVDCPHLLIRQ